MHARTAAILATITLQENLPNCMSEIISDMFDLPKLSLMLTLGGLLSEPQFL
jgi:hypothetical protein